MRLPFFQIDAFTSHLFRGNPAGVVLLEQEITPDLMQSIAAENNLSETAFILPRNDSLFSLRWFTPSIEVSLCGHATLASAFVLFQLGKVTGEVHFETASGRLTVRESPQHLSLDFPAAPPTPTVTSDELIRALGKEPFEVLSSRDLMAVFQTEEEVSSLQPDFDELARLDAFAVIVTAPGRKVDFVSRFFAPRAGVPEDPVTGSAHCTLTPFWAERLQKQILRARQVSRRGGELLCEERGDRVIISGAAVEYLRGEINV